MIAIIDYDAGNIKSVEKALLLLGEEVVLTRDADVLMQAEKVILPGVGAFGDAMDKLKEYGLVDVIKRVVEKGTPFLGICLGLQLLFESSQESPGVEGLGILKGKIVRIPDGTDVDGTALKIPHIGWNSLEFPKEGRLFADLPEESYVYFVHSYYLKAEEDIVTARTHYGVAIDASVEKGNVFACQFHPEKSSEVGLQILKNFVSIGR
ncbi:MAG: imidazole glycerol phosphate synthase subunit HisH [Lachnospiraceae bacterium]|nr:imidazole glycerol phosphate synthase subunit HisH [Lachnospiraceae bacterium]